MSLIYRNKSGTHSQEIWQRYIHTLEEHPVPVTQVTWTWVAYPPTNSDTLPLTPPRDSLPPTTDTLITHRKASPHLHKDSFLPILDRYLPIRGILAQVIPQDRVQEYMAHSQGGTQSVLWPPLGSLTLLDGPPHLNPSTDTRNRWQPWQTPGPKPRPLLSTLERHQFQFASHL